MPTKADNGQTIAANTLQAHTGPDHRIVRHDARWSACPPCNRWIDTRGRD